MKILLVEPNFPIPKKSKNHKNFLPIGLLKIAAYLKDKGHDVSLIKGEGIESFDFRPDEIWITSLFTYWAEYVKNSVKYYRRMFPKAKIKVGGIYASLMPKHCKEFTRCDEIYKGVYEEAENYSPLYELVDTQNPHPIDYQIIHASRGCPRRCDFCGTWKIEPEFKSKKTIINEIKKNPNQNKIIFYDNNLLVNPYIEDIFDEIIMYNDAVMEYNYKNTDKKKQLVCESQSGFDGRILLNRPHLAEKIKKARFINPKIAWDGKYGEWEQIKRQLDLLLKAGYNHKSVSLFMLYNWNILFEEMEKKRLKCWDWKIQISDCRYKPLDQLYDHYNGRKKQDNSDYYIHKGWTDELIKQFRKNIRSQNICIRHDIDYYSPSMERMRIPTDSAIKYKKLPYEEAKEYLADAWNPAEVHYPNLK